MLQSAEQTNVIITATPSRTKNEANNTEVRNGLAAWACRVCTQCIASQAFVSLEIVLKGNSLALIVADAKHPWW
eukprot:scaffold514121_cov17-Prasinocladus_malaysianus.AAC.1